MCPEAALHLMGLRPGRRSVVNESNGHYEYFVMQFGLTNAIFQNVINYNLPDMLNQYFFVYLNDILVFSKTWGIHIHHVETVLQRLLENLLFIKAEKCEFHVPLISFVSHVVSKDAAKVDPNKVTAIGDWPVPGFSGSWSSQTFTGISFAATARWRLPSPLSPAVWTPTSGRLQQKRRSVTSSTPHLGPNPPDHRPALPVLGQGGHLESWVRDHPVKALRGRPEAAPMCLFLLASAGGEGATGWRVPGNRSSCGQITRTWNTTALPRNPTLYRHSCLGGLGTCEAGHSQPDQT